jgi:hypothetical protein
MLESMLVVLIALTGLVWLKRRRRRKESAGQ